MKTAYKWFDQFFTVLFFSTTGFLVVILCYLLFENYLWGKIAVGDYSVQYILAFIEPSFNFLQDNGTVLVSIFAILLGIVVLAGVMYVFVGLLFLLRGKKDSNKKKVTLSLGKRLLFRGILRSVVGIILFFVLNIVISFIGVSDSDCGPALCDSYSRVDSPQKNPITSASNFPPKDLKIINRSQVIFNTNNCWITLLNTNKTLNADNISINFDGRGMTSMIGHLAPGHTEEIMVYNGAKTKIQCNDNLIINIAGVTK